MSVTRYLDNFLFPTDFPVLTDDPERLDDPAFWPAFAFLVRESETAPHAFDVDPADVEQYAADLMLDEKRWPSITLELAAGHRMLIVFRNLEEDTGIDYLLQPADGGETLIFCLLDGHFRGPALRWSELLTVAGQAPVPGRAQRLLLLLPTLGDSETPDDAIDVVAEALDDVGVLPEHRLTLARELLDNGAWNDADWEVTEDQVSCRWYHSSRRRGSPAERLALFSEALRPTS